MNLPSLTRRNRMKNRPKTEAAKRAWPKFVTEWRTYARRATVLLVVVAALAGREAPTAADLWPLVYAVPTEAGQQVARDQLRDLLASSESSALPAAPAAEAGDQVPAEVKEQRLAELLALRESQRQAFTRETLGRRFGVVFDKPGRHAGQLVGRSPYMQGVHAECPPETAGRMTQVEVVEVGPNSLKGRLV